MKSVYHMFFAVTCLAPVSGPGAEGSAPKPPNVVLVVAEGLGWNDCGPYGSTQIRTPNLDLLAKQGIRFEQAVLTCSASGPSRYSILTGRHPHSTGAPEPEMPLPADQLAVTEPLREQGYFTAAAGPWHMGPSVARRFGLVNDGGGRDGCRDWLEVLRNRPKDKPFFLWLASRDPQRPFTPQRGQKAHQPSEVVVPPYLPDTDEVRNELALYYDGIARFDDKLGALLAELAEEKVAAETLVIVLSDSGSAFPRCKATVLEAGIRFPLLMRWPGHIPAGTTSASLVSSVDLAPTILELCGASPQLSMEGTTLVPLFDTPQGVVRRYCYAEHHWCDYQASERAVRSSQYLYVRNDLPELPRTPSADVVRSPTFAAMRQLRDAGKLTAVQMDVFIQPRPAEELYDTQADPYAVSNLVHAPKCAAALAEMRGMLRAWQKLTGDSMSLPTPDQYDRETGRRLDAGIARTGISSPPEKIGARVAPEVTTQ